MCVCESEASAQAKLRGIGWRRRSVGGPPRTVCVGVESGNQEMTQAMSQLALAAGAGVAGAALVHYVLSRRHATAAKCCATTVECCAATADREAVRRAYTDVAAGSASCCVTSVKEGGAAMGYSADERNLGESTGADLGLGCGHPVSLACLREGEADGCITLTRILALTLALAPALTFAQARPWSTLAAAPV